MVGVVGVVVPGAGPGAAGGVGAGGIQLGDHAREYAEVVALAPRVPCEFVLPAPVAKAPQVLVVAVPQDEAGVGHEAHDVLAGLGLHLAAQRLLLRVGGAGEGEVLPDHEAELVAGVVEGVVLVDAAAPDAYEVDVGIGGLGEAGAVALGGDAGGQDVVGDPVDAACEDADAVDDEGEAGAVFVGAAVDLDGAEADSVLPGVQRPVAFEERQLDVVQRLFAVSAWPPEVCVGDVQGECGCVALEGRVRLDARHRGPCRQRTPGALRGALDLNPQLDTAR